MHSADASPGTAPLRRVLLCQPRWMGDVLLCTPALHALRRTLPHARIDFLTEPAGAAALEGNPDLDGIVLLPASPSDRIGMMRRLRKVRYDAVIDFRSTGSTAAAALASGAPVRVGVRGRGLRSLAYTRLLPRETGPVYMALQKLRMVAPLGVDPESAGLRLHIAIGVQERSRADALLGKAGIAGGETVVAISGASRVAEKRWGAAHWARVADRLAAAGCRIILTHGPGELDQARAIARLMKHTGVTDYGSTTVRELAALYARCVVWLGNDGGPKHIAVAAGTPTVAVVKAGTGAVWNDTEDPRQRFVAAGPVACSTCAGECVGSASEDAVVRHAMDLWPH
jgi:ADP-heptose:LPS heptosyltransferase